MRDVLQPVPPVLWAQMSWYVRHRRARRQAQAIQQMQLEHHASYHQHRCACPDHLGARAS